MAKKQLWAKSAKRAKKLHLQWYRDKNGNWHDTLTGDFSKGPPLVRKGRLWYKGGIPHKPPSEKSREWKPPTQPLDLPHLDPSELVRDRMREIFNSVKAVMGGHSRTYINPDNSVDGEIRLPIPHGYKDIHFATDLGHFDWSLPSSFLSAEVLSDIKTDDFDIRKKAGKSPLYDEQSVMLGKPYPSISFGGFWQSTKAYRPHFFLSLYKLVLASSTNYKKKVKGIVIHMRWRPDGSHPFE